MKVIEAIKKIYPTIQGGFVYWQTNQDGSSLVNPIDGLIWENAEFTKPTWEQIEAQLSIVELEEAKNSKISQCLAYLLSTDWQIIRLSDPTSGESLKEGVGENRALARSLQDDIKACTTLEELNAININFE